MKCSRCGIEKNELAEDLEFVVLDVEDYKRITPIGVGWPSGVRWEIEGWKVSETGRYRSAVCADCAKALIPILRKKRLAMVGAGLLSLALSPISISMMDKIPIIGFFGGWFVFPIAGFAAFIMAYQRHTKQVVFDGYHRKAWSAGGGQALHASYGLLPRQKDIQMRFLLSEWEQIRASYGEERAESGWSHFIIARHFTLSADDQPTKEQTLEYFEAKHMGEVMDRHPHKKR
jgi:hypothetical protein